MSNDNNLLAVLSLCRIFKDKTEECIQKSEELTQKATDVMKPHMDAAEEVMSALLEMVENNPFDNPEDIVNDYDFQMANLKVIEFGASIMPNILDAQDVWDALPDELKNNADAASILRQHGAENMANICLNAPPQP